MQREKVPEDGLEYTRRLLKTIKYLVGLHSRAGLITPRGHSPVQGWRLQARWPTA